MKAFWCQANSPTPRSLRWQQDRLTWISCPHLPCPVPMTYRGTNEYLLIIHPPSTRLEVFRFQFHTRLSGANIATALRICSCWFNLINIFCSPGDSHWSRAGPRPKGSNQGELEDSGLGAGVLSPAGYKSGSIVFIASGSLSMVPRGSHRILV